VRTLVPVLVGEAPSRDTEGLPPFSGRSGARLAELLGEDPAEAFALENLLRRWPGPAGSGKGSAFPLGPARKGARRLLRAYRGRRFILAGWRVASAFGVRPCGHWPRELEWCGDWAHSLDGSGAGAGSFAVLPHPSGVNLWWNDPANVERARRFLREAARCAE
jgi:uracil-DNA glycosylase